MVKEQIEKKLGTELKPQFLTVDNESYMHAVPPDSETHFKVTIVSNEFDNKRAVQRHQLIYGLLSEELSNGVHALALHTYTPKEWLDRGDTPTSPNCMGVGK